VNPHTGVAYKDEPNIIAFEISNEPHHKGTPEEVTNFVQRMVTSMRSTGTKKPIFYNVSHSTHLMEAYFEQISRVVLSSGILQDWDFRRNWREFTS
jgi:hypothetical protein